ncbi:MAG: hypothetical protein K8J08_02790 [Thermoanaerobaculia bacterium]|nr:hypothetical protein [Thermoanaerobaculia bacterium]
MTTTAAELLLFDGLELRANDSAVEAGAAHQPLFTAVGQQIFRRAIWASGSLVIGIN